MLSRADNPPRRASGQRARAIRPAVRSVSKPRLNRRIRYELDDPCPPLVTAGVAFQGVVLVLANTVLMVTIIVRAAGEGELYLGWAVFAALARPRDRGDGVPRRLGEGEHRGPPDLSERAETPEESELSFRLLRHYASSVRHRQYHGIEIVTVKVAGSR